MLNHFINVNLATKLMVWCNIEAIPKFDIKPVIKSDIKFDMSTKLITGKGMRYWK